MHKVIYNKIVPPILLFSLDMHAIKIWGLYTYLLGPMIFKGSIINSLLKVPERAFTSSHSTTRGETYVSWKYLIANFGQQEGKNGHLAPKRLKLLMSPFLNRFVFND